MKFYGHGLVWNKPIIKFIDGKFETENKDIIEKLLTIGFEYEGEIPDDEKLPVEMTVEQIKDALKEKGIEFKTSMKKDELYQLLTTTEGS